MAAPQEALSPKEQLRTARNNYLECLNLSSSAQVLIISDEQLPRDSKLDPNITVRRALASSLEEGIRRKGNNTQIIHFSQSAQEADFYDATKLALKELNELNATEDSDTVVVFLANDLPGRTGMYKAVNEFGEGKTVKMAGSLGFTTGDLRVLSELDSEKILALQEASANFDRFFENHPKGSFEITTQNPSGDELKLTVDYDTTMAPVNTELGILDGIHEEPLSTYPNIKYINIPGGEKFCSPYPFKNTDGRFSADRISFLVKNGMIKGVEVDHAVEIKNLNKSQTELIEIIRSGQMVPLSEFGLGLYSLIGQKTYPDSSLLSREKSGPHLGAGHMVADSPEQKEADELAANFHHTDFVLDKPVITLSDPQEPEKRKQFYPPLNG